MIYIATGLVFISITITVIKTLLEKDIFTKLLFLNSSINLSGLFICFLATFKTYACYIDIALIYYLLSFISTNAYLQFFLAKHKNVKRNIK